MQVSYSLRDGSANYNSMVSWFFRLLSECLVLKYFQNMLTFSIRFIDDNTLAMSYSRLTFAAELSYNHSISQGTWNCFLQ